MKKETIFKHELNESIQANAALRCLKNRNNHKQINEVAPVVAAAGRMLLPMLRPIITKLVQKALVKIGTHARPTQVITHVMGMLTKGEFAKKMAEKCGQTWNEIPSEVKKEIQDAIIAAFKKQAPQEQEEEDYTNDEIPSPNFSYRMSFMVWAMREIIPYLKEISQVCAQADPTALKHAVMKILKTRDTGIPETPRSCREWAKQNYDWVEMELNGEYDAYQKKWSKPFNIPSEQEETDEISDFDRRFAYRKDLRDMATPLTKKAYMIIRNEFGDSMWRQLGMTDCNDMGLIDMLNHSQKYFNITDPQDLADVELGRKSFRNFLKSHEEQEETTDEKGAFALKLVKKFKNRMTPDYAKRPELYMMLKLQKALKKPLMSLSKEEYRAWAKAICDACDSVFGSQEQEEDTLNAYYSQDEPDYENDHHGIWLIINIMRKMGMLRAQGIEGRDNVDDGHAIDAAYDLIEQKLDEEGMWIGDDDHEAERFVSFFGDEIAAEAMKSAIHNQQSQEQEENSLDTEWFSDLEEQEAYYENFRAIAELVADQIDRENGKDIDNNMDTIFEIVREVWNNNPDDLYIWDFDDVQEDACYKFFDKYYETIKNEYLKREHNNIMAATHDDLFAY